MKKTYTTKEKVDFDEIPAKKPVTWEIGSGAVSD